MVMVINLQPLGLNPIEATYMYVAIMLIHKDIAYCLILIASHSTQGWKGTCKGIVWKFVTSHEHHSAVMLVNVCS